MSYRMQATETLFGSHLYAGPQGGRYVSLDVFSRCFRFTFLGCNLLLQPINQFPGFRRHGNFALGDLGRADLLAVEIFIGAGIGLQRSIGEGKIA